MKRLSELMADLGFREDAPESVKTALVQGLMKSLTPSETSFVLSSKIVAPSAPTHSPQLSLFAEELPLLPKPSNKIAG